MNSPLCGPLRGVVAPVVLREDSGCSQAWVKECGAPPVMSVRSGALRIGEACPGPLSGAGRGSGPAHCCTSRAPSSVTHTGPTCWLPREGGTAGCCGVGGLSGASPAQTPSPSLPSTPHLLGSGPDGSARILAPPGADCPAQPGAAPAAVCALLPPGLAPSCPRLVHPWDDGEKWGQLPHVRPTTDLSILKGECHTEVAHAVPCPTRTPTLRGIGKRVQESRAKLGGPDLSAWLGKGTWGPAGHSEPWLPAPDRLVKAVSPQPPLTQEQGGLGGGCEQRGPESPFNLFTHPAWALPGSAPTRGGAGRAGTL